MNLVSCYITKLLQHCKYSTMSNISWSSANEINFNTIENAACKYKSVQCAYGWICSNMLPYTTFYRIRCALHIFPRLKVFPKCFIQARRLYLSSSYNFQIAIEMLCHSRNAFAVFCFLLTFFGSHIFESNVYVLWQ